MHIHVTFVSVALDILRGSRNLTSNILGWAQAKSILWMECLSSSFCKSFNMTPVRDYCMPIKLLNYRQTVSVTLINKHNEQKAIM